MEDLLEFIAVIFVLVGLISKSRKRKGKKAPQSRQWKKLEKSLNQMFDEPVAESTKAKQKAPEAPQPSPMGEMTHEGIHPCVEHGMPPEQLTMNLQPAPVSGSLPETTHEGAHPCDIHNAAPLTVPEITPKEEQPGLQLNWTGDSMMEAFIMQEVLTRPCQRKRA